MGREHALQVSILLSGGVIVLALLAKACLQRIHASNALGYIAIGFLLGLVVGVAMTATSVNLPVDRWLLKKWPP